MRDRSKKKKTSVPKRARRQPAPNSARPNSTARQRRSEEALRESDDRFRNYFELGLIGMAMTSPTKGILEVNDELCRILRYKRSELVKKSWAEMTHPDDLAADVEQFNRVMDGEIDGYSLEKRWIRKDRQIVHSIMAAKCHRRPNGSVDYFVGLVLDISERKRSEEALRESENKFSVVFDKASFAIALTKLPDGIIVDVNPAWVEMFGFTKEEAVGRTSVELGINRDVERRSRLFSNVVARGSVRNLEETLFHKSGVPRLIACNIEVVSFGSDNYFLSTMRDVTEHKKAEADLRRSEAYLAEGERIAQMGSWAVKLPSGEIFWSREMFRIYQLDPATTKLSTPEVFEVIHPEDRQFVREAFERSVREKSNYEVRHRAILPDGTLKYFHSLGRPVLNQAGELVEYLGTVIDVTKQTEAETLLRAANEKIEMVLDSISEQFFALSKDWRFTYFNQHAAAQMRRLGKDPERMIGKLLWEEFPEVPNEANLRRVMSERVPITDELYYAPLGEWLENHMYPSQDGGLVSFQRYITSRKRTEEELLKTQAELAQVLRVTTMGEMAASIAHEINQPLGAVVNNGNVCLQLIDVPGSKEKWREALLDIVHDANRASAIIARIRALTKRSTSEKKLLPIRDLIDEVLALANHAATGAGVKITTSVPDSLRIIGDRIQLQQMLLNLVMNAIEAPSDVEKGKRRITIRGSLGELENNAAVVVSVQDNGRGFSSENAGRLFEPFFTTKPNGMGMGLGISRSIIEAHGGRLWAKRNESGGATFYCAWPTEKDIA